jgi:DNA polymerase sigma
MATELAFEESDLDLAICGLKPISKENLLKCIQEFSQRLTQLPFVKTCQTITTAKVPVVKLVRFMQK